MIALDASVLLDILTDDPRHAEASETLIADALAREDVVVCDAVVAEVQAMLDTSASLMEVLAGLGIRYQPTQEAAAMRAGHMYRRFRIRGGQGERVIGDFLIGAHALLQCDALITRDAAFFRDYFKGLKLIVPSA
ncbi:type II toxin-antitoxin system VapC family toxin [Luteimonas abyssi]|uniref:type II toxin-antitoxin system VapC family toxin n=1 Tax=Luteimonas abyssi TaxID=1247514 RepID=UPI000737B48B|nr:PIN domain-containing protein [Luteimonas abyssi]